MTPGPNRQIRRTVAQAAKGQVLTEADLQSKEPWVTLVEDESCLPGHPRSGADSEDHRIYCHPDDLVEMEQLAVANGMRVRAEGKLMERLGTDQPYDVAMGYRVQ